MEMKKLFVYLFLVVSLFFNIAIADENDIDDDAIYLKDDQTFSINTKRKDTTKLNNIDFQQKKDFRISPQNVYQHTDQNPYSTKSTSFTKEKKHGNFTLGTKYNSSFAPNTYSQTNTLFTKYQKNKFSFNTSYSNNALTSFAQQSKGTLAFSPEYKLNNHVSLQSIYSTNFLDKNHKNEFVFSLKPFKDDRMNFDLGASQIYSENSAPTRSQLNFSTKFNF